MQGCKTSLSTSNVHLGVLDPRMWSGKKKQPTQVFFNKPPRHILIPGKKTTGRIKNKKQLANSLPADSHWLLFATVTPPLPNSRKRQPNVMQHVPSLPLDAEHWQLLEGPHLLVGSTADEWHQHPHLRQLLRDVRPNRESNPQVVGWLKGQWVSILKLTF